MIFKLVDEGLKLPASTIWKRLRRKKIDDAQLCNRDFVKKLDEWLAEFRVPGKGSACAGTEARECLDERVGEVEPVFRCQKLSKTQVI